MSADITFWHTEKDKEGNLRWKEFPRLDPVATANIAQPAEKAGRFATSNAVDAVANDHSLTTHEVEMLEVVNHHLLDLQTFHTRAIEAISEEIAKTGSASTIDELFDFIRIDFAAGLEKLRTAFDHNHKTKLKDLLQARRDLSNFKRKNEIDRERADYPDSAYAHFFWIFVALAVEGAANAGFFPQNLGLLGGFVTAVGVSAVNVALSFIVGFLFLRNLNHLRIPRKLLGALGLIVAIPLIALLHLTVAHYREAVVRGEDVNVFAVVPQVWSSPFGIQDMESMMLILIGTVVSIVAIYKGYTFDDRYPGFGKAYRLWNEYMEEVSEHVAETKQQATDLYNVAAKATLAIPKKLRDRERALRVIDGKVKAYFSCFETYYEQSEQTAQSLVVAFRQATQQVLEDQRRFPVDFDEIRAALRDTDPRNERSTVIAQLESHEVALQSAIKSFENEKDALLRTLKEEMNTFGASLASFGDDNRDAAREWIVGGGERANGSQA